MTHRANRYRPAMHGNGRASMPTWLPWGVLGVVAVTLTLLAFLGPKLPGLLAMWTGKPLSLTIIHSNDTWGFLLPCG